MKKKPLMNIMGTQVYPLGEKDPTPGKKDYEEERQESINSKDHEHSK